MPVARQYLKKTSFDTFDPNHLTQDSPLWAVYDGSTFKTYTGRGPALQATTTAWRARLYEFTNNVWVERAVKPNHRLDTCTVCGDTTIGDYNYNYGQWLWQKVKGKITSPPELHFACRGCQDSVRYG